MNEKKAYLVLEDSTVFAGRPFGANGHAVGELVFTTGMTGFLEVLSEPACYGQIVIQTFPLAGNYGVITEDFSSDKITASAYIVKEWCRGPSNFRCKRDFDAFFKDQGIIGLEGVDTRALTKLIRERGVMNGQIVSDVSLADTAAMKAYRVREAVRQVSTKTAYVLAPEHAPSDRILRVAAPDYGLTEDVKKELLRRGCALTVYPYDTGAETMLKDHPHGILLGEGPGDPADEPDIIRGLQALWTAGVPVMGMGLGHQLLARGAGFATEKLRYGHRGGNQPVRRLSDGRIFNASQNHGYTVTVPERCGKTETLFVNLNDGSNEGLAYQDAPIFSVQFRPVTQAGPQNTGFLYDRFITMMEDAAHAVG